MNPDGLSGRGTWRECLQAIGLLVAFCALAALGSCVVGTPVPASEPIGDSTHETGCLYSRVSGVYSGVFVRDEGQDSGSGAIGPQAAFWRVEPSRRRLARKTRSDAVLGNLPDDDAEELATLFEQGWPLAKIREHVALSREDGGLDLRVSLSTLSTWWRGQSSSRLLQRIRRAREQAQEVAAAAESAGDLDAAALGAIRTTVFDLASQPGSDPQAIRALAGILGESAKLRQRAQQLDLQERRLRLLEEERAENRARAIADLDRLANGGVTEESVNALRERIRAL